MASLAESLGKELETIDREYANDFAGHSRLTRDIGQIERMIAKAESVLARVEQIPVAARGADLHGVHSGATQSIALYKQERAAIARAQEVGPVFELFSSEATSANTVFARYARHFAGKDRTTRDVALLAELVDELKQIEKRMSGLIEEHGHADFQKDRTIVRENLGQYQKEIEQIEKAQSSGSPEDQASILANIANSQFAVYQVHFAGEPRVSRRPTLLIRVITQLKKIKDRMQALKKGGLDVEFNDKNIAIVEDRLATYERELTEIRKLRQATPMTDIMGELGGAANKLFDEYRQNYSDKPRSSADAARLGNICDKLGEIRRQMVETSWAEESDMNSKNLEIVNEQLAMFEAEYEAVVRAQAGKAPTAL